MTVRLKEGDACPLGCGGTLVEIAESPVRNPLSGQMEKAFGCKGGRPCEMRVRDLGHN